MKLRKENKQLRMEKEILKRPVWILRKKNEVKLNFIKQNEGTFPVKKQCELMRVSRSCYYAWRNRLTKVISASELMLYRRSKLYLKKFAKV